MADKKENELSELERFEKTVKKGIEIFKDYECVIERVKKAKEAYAKITQIANKMEQINQLQSAAINRVLMIRQPLMGKYNGQVVIATTGTSLWAKAQNELNLAMKANIIGIVVSGLGVLISTLGACQLATNNMADSTGELSEKQKDIIKNSQQTIEDIKQEAQARKERVVASGDEFNTTQALWGELQKCVDANGKIRTGYEERAQYVRGELANTLGIEIDIVNGQIKNYGTLNKSVQDVIASKKIEAMLDTMEPEYNKAKEKSQDL